ncbi:hypothetical protein [Actinomadura rubrisoli]|uniref:Uncharacterized protein n=1 Tax=Actinomadura rubrisoli TaxID=2530368 RepID=A0A4R5BK92_9ACTN|nr:hypothetical protein [Actinomadura rubrisoli]TDD86099.1 hypothetical protein E1298_17815 [Actinomadura rubrisoli]
MPTDMIWIEYNGFIIGPLDSPPVSTELPYRTGLVAAAQFEPAGGAVVVTGIKDDQIRVTAELLTAEPAIVLDVWEDVAVVGIDWPGGVMRVIGADVIPPSVMPFTGELPPGPMMVLVAGRNRDAGEQRGDDDPIEEYLINVWPGEEPDRMPKATSRVGAIWRDATPPPA